MERRQFLKLSLAPFFSANDQFAAILANLLQGQTLTESEALQLTLPENAEDGASVPMQFRVDLNQVSRILILVEKNPTPLILQFIPLQGMRPSLNSRIKMAESCYVWLIAETSSGWLSAKTWVNVMKPGCGTG